MRAGGVDERRLLSSADGHGLAMDDTDASSDACRGCTWAAVLAEAVAAAAISSQPFGQVVVSCAVLLVLRLSESGHDRYFNISDTISHTAHVPTPHVRMPCRALTPPRGSLP